MKLCYVDKLPFQASNLMALSRRRYKNHTGIFCYICGGDTLTPK